MNNLLLPIDTEVIWEAPDGVFRRVTVVDYTADDGARIQWESPFHAPGKMPRIIAHNDTVPLDRLSVPFALLKELQTIKEEEPTAPKQVNEREPKPGIFENMSAWQTALTLFAAMPLLAICGLLAAAGCLLFWPFAPLLAFYTYAEAERITKKREELKALR